MELKVWVEGIQRVICGVTEATTCQDVVMALAHASGKTGRFTLIEKWRDNERLLSPTDCPLKALHKWGEYATDVFFILRHSSANKKERTGKRTDQFSHNFSPHSAGDRMGTPNRSLKKSLTFSGAHSYPKNHLSAVRKKLIQDNNSLESIDDRSSVTSQSSRSTMSPYGSLEKRHHHSRHIPVPYHNNNNISSPYGSLEKPHKTKSHKLKSPSPAHSSGSYHSHSSPKSGNTPTNSLERRTKRSTHSPHRSGQKTHSSKPKKEIVEEYDLDRHLGNNSSAVPQASGQIGHSSKVSQASGHLVHHPAPPGGVDFTKVNGKVGKDTEFREGSPKVPPTDNSTAEGKDLLNLVKLQKEKLSVQEARIKFLDSEIELWDNKDKDCDRQTAEIGGEVELLQKKYAEDDNELQELDIVSWADKLEIDKQNAKTLQAEITLMRSRLANCETELLQNKNKIHPLNESIDAEKKERTKQERLQKEEEIRVLQEISDLQKQVNERLMQHEKNQKEIESLQNDVKKCESSILERKAQITDCEKELKEANMDVFMKVPNSLEGSSTALNRMSPSRPGSARKMMYSPLLLKDVVATTTNPHGLWV